MLKKVSSKSHIAIALLLIGSCVLTTTLISKAFGINLKFEYGFTPGGEVEDTDQDKWEVKFDDRNSYASAWIEGYRIDDNGDVLGKVDCNIGAQQYDNHNGDNVVTFWGVADSRLLDWDLVGQGNAWVKLPGRGRVGPGKEVDIGNGHDKHYVYTDDSYTVLTHSIRGRRAEAGAKVRVFGTYASVKVSAVRQ